MGCADTPDVSVLELVDVPNALPTVTVTDTEEGRFSYVLKNDTDRDYFFLSGGSGPMAATYVCTDGRWRSDDVWTHCMAWWMPLRPGDSVEGMAFGGLASDDAKLLRVGVVLSEDAETWFDVLSGEVSPIRRPPRRIGE